MSVPVPLEDLKSQMEARSDAGYLLTVTPDGRPHCVAVALAWDGEEIVMGAGRSSVRNASERRHVTLLLPPADRSTPSPGAGEDAGYSLIVDADVEGAFSDDEHGSVVRVRPAHAVLHRPAVGDDGRPAHDCVHVYDAVSSS